MNLAQIFQMIVQVAKNDATKSILPHVSAFLNSVASNPTAINFVAQLAQLQAQILADLPAIEQDILKQIATTVATEAAALANKPTP